ncbi:hypothetical protein MASR2M70_07040 [Bacillota bacterium]
MSWKFVLSLIFALVVALFAIQNAGVVNVDFLVWNVSISQALIILLSAVVGAIVGALLGLIGHVKLKAAIRGDKRTITSLEEENKNLKTKLEAALKASAATSPPAGEAIPGQPDISR